MPKMEIEIKAIGVESDPYIIVYETIVRDEEGQAVWNETWGSKELLKAFLRGVEAAFSFTEILVKIPPIPEFPEYKAPEIEKIKP